jgi:hypothetical protein
MKAKILPITLTVIVGTIGFIIGRNSGTSTTDSASVGSSTSGVSSNNTSAASSDFASSTRRSAATARSGTSTADRPSLTKGTPADRIQALKDITDPIERARMWLQIIESLSPEEFEGFVAAYRADGMAMERMGDYAMLLNAWAKVDPNAALDYASKNTGNPFARQTILAAWAGYDPESAISWAKANHSGDGANPWMVGVIKGLASQDPDRATALLNEMPRSVERGEALDSLLPSIMKRGIAESRDWVDAITDPALREGAMMRVAEATASKDPLGTADWLVANPSQATNRRIDDALYAMARSDQQSAMSYFNKLPAGDTRSNALRGIINAVAVDNPQKAATLMDTYSGDISDRTVQQFVWHSFRQNPQAAISSIARMRDADEQERMYNRSLEWWIERDQQAAINWIRSNQLPPNVLQRVERNLQRTQQESN